MELRDLVVVTLGFMGTGVQGYVCLLALFRVGE